VDESKVLRLGLNEATDFDLTTQLGELFQADTHVKNQHRLTHAVAFKY